MKKLFKLLFILVSLNVFSQTQNQIWEKTFGGSSYESIKSIIASSDGGYLLGGNTKSNNGDIQSGNYGNGDFWVVKINSTGTIEWEQTYGGFDKEELISINSSSDGGYIISGNTKSNDGDIQSENHGNGDFWVVKISDSGNIEWEQTYGGGGLDFLYSIVPTSDHGYLLSGYTESIDGDIQSGNHGQEDYWVVKINSTGTIEWEQTYGGSKGERVYSVTSTSDEGYILSGHTNSDDGDIQSGYHGFIDSWVVKINNTGTIEWEQTYGGASSERFCSSITTSDGGYLLGGYTYSADGDIQSGNHGESDFWVVKINNMGIIEWEQTYGGSITDNLYSIIHTSDNGYLLSGYTQSDDGDVQSGNHGFLDFWVVKINYTGTIEWEQTYGGSEYEILYSTITTSDGGYLLGGTTKSIDGGIQSGNNGETDFWIVKIGGTSGINESYIEIINTYPIPVKNKLFVNLANLQIIVHKILLYNSNGRLVYNSKDSRLTSSIIGIPVQEFNSGLYVLNLYTDKGILTRKISIIR